MLVALYRRETVALGAAVVEALEDADGPDDATSSGSSVRAYFDELAPPTGRAAGAVVTGPGVPALADPDDVATRFAVSLLRRYHGLDGDHAKAVAGMVQGAMVGAAATVLADAVPRASVEEALAGMIGAALTTST